MQLVRVSSVSGAPYTDVVLLRFPLQNLTLWTSDMQESESKPTEGASAEAPAAETKGEEAA